LTWNVLDFSFTSLASGGHRHRLFRQQTAWSTWPAAAAAAAATTGSTRPIHVPPLELEITDFMRFLTVAAAAFCMRQPPVGGRQRIKLLLDRLLPAPRSQTQSRTASKGHPASQAVCKRLTNRQAEENDGRTDRETGWFVGKMLGLVAVREIEFELFSVVAAADSCLVTHIDTSNFGFLLSNKRRHHAPPPPPCIKEKLHAKPKTRYIGSLLGGTPTGRQGQVQFPKLNVCGRLIFSLRLNGLT
jgi:hypothetical protein